MPNETSYTRLLGDLRATLATLKPGQDAYAIIASRDEVFAKYQPIFSTDHVSKLSREEFTSFLYFDNNHHWSGLYRKGLHAADDIEDLREGLEVLLDERKPIHDRFGVAVDMVEGLGKATATAILTVAYPDSYGVWNNTSEVALREAGLWPDFSKGEGLGARYARINDLLARIRTELDIDFWKLDALWPILSPDVAAAPEKVPETVSQKAGGFALERQLEVFLLENWEQTSLAKEWAIYATSEDPEAGNQFPTDVGPIDILAIHKAQPRLLVIELKRNQGNDQTIGQVLRYMGWVEKHLGQETGKTVAGLIVARKIDKSASYALSLLPNVSMMTYEIEFHLRAYDKVLI